ncbi:MAG: hypothetical protein J6Q48_05425 [Bacteroidaceae bacterium]|nr:hypothetical protein [Bacteroidaceae bacterium]
MQFYTTQKIGETILKDIIVAVAKETFKKRKPRHHNKVKTFKNTHLNLLFMAIPVKYRNIVRNSLIAAAGISPLGLFGTLDTVGVAACWTTMFFAIKEESDSSFSGDPKRIALNVATGIASYYLGCKAATFAMFCIPGLGPLVAIVAALGVSACCNIYFTYKFAIATIDLMNKPSYSNDNVIQAFLDILKKLPSVKEVKEIAEIYRG